MQKTTRKKKLLQPPSSYADCNAAIMSTDEDTAMDFGILANAPLSKGGHFVFKSEKDWSSIDPSSEYSEFFTLNLNTLSAAIKCIPFNEYVDVDDRYFTNDQLTSICNNSEEGKVAYNKLLDTLNVQSATFSKNETNENIMTDQTIKSVPTATDAENPLEKDINNLEDDIDFLLNLTEPLQCSQPLQSSTAIAQTFSTSRNNDIESKTEHLSIDLEKWLESVLDD